jgi:fatty-acid desaturase
MVNSIGIAVLVSIAWIIGAIELVDTVTHFSAQWYWFVLATAYTVTLNEIFCHRICTHKLFEINTDSITYKILTFLLTVDLAWSPLTNMCKVHLNHHLYSDQGENDNLNWRKYWYNICTLSPIAYLYQSPSHYPNEEIFFARQKQRFSILLNDTWTFFVEENRFLLTIMFWLILYYTVPTILFKVVLMGRLLMSIYMACVSIGCHVKLPLINYRNFNTNDTTHNNLVFHYISLGLFSSMLHNNHHAMAGKLNHAHRWFEVDSGYYIIKLLKPLLEKK